LLDEKELVVEGVEDNDQTDWIVKAKLSDGFFLVSSGKRHQAFNAIATKCCIYKADSQHILRVVKYIH